MSSLYCSQKLRHTAPCLYNVDCHNSKKNNSVHEPCPAEFDCYEILGCSKNNSSKTCPVLLCNFEKQARQNVRIFSRNFPEEKNEIIPDYRGEYKVCDKYINKNSIPKKFKKHTNNIIGITGDEENKLYPGKAPAHIYFQNVDIESDLKRLGNPDTLCPSKDYRQPLCEKDTIKTNNPNLLKNPTCQNYKYYDFSKEDILPDYKNKCGSISDEITKYNSETFQCNEQNTPYKTTSLLKYNYKARDTIPCTTGCLARNEGYVDIKQPLPYANNSSHMLKQPVLQIGPERVNHRIENVWNNVSRRKHISGIKN